MDLNSSAPAKLRVFTGFGAPCSEVRLYGALEAVALYLGGWKRLFIWLGLPIEKPEQSAACKYQKDKREKHVSDAPNDSRAKRSIELRVRAQFIPWATKLNKLVGL